MSEVTRTVAIKSTPLPRRIIRVFVELESMYRNMVEQLALYATRNNITSFTKLKALKYRELRTLYPLPSHYAYTACQDASTRVKSFLRLKRKGVTGRDIPEVKAVSIWLDDHLWKMDGLTSIRIATHKGWVRVELEPGKQYWRYINSGWKLSSEVRVKLDRRSRRLVVHLVFKKSVEVYKPRGFISVDVNENHVAVLVDGEVYLFITGFRDAILGYYYRRKRVQEKYDKLYGVRCRVKRRILSKLKEKKFKNDLRWKLANIIVRIARERQYGIVLEKLGKNPAKGMIKHIKNNQLRHRIYQASFKGLLKAIEEKAREYGVPVVYVNPKNSSKTCPVHDAKIVYEGGRVGRCSRGGELWHREVVACINHLLKAHEGDGSIAPSPRGRNVDGSPMPLGSTATHEPTLIPRKAWVRWKSLDATNKHKLMRISIQGQTVADIDMVGHKVGGFAGVEYNATMVNIIRLTLRFVEALEREGLLNKTLLVILNDHGFKRGGHHGGLEPEVRRVFTLFIGSRVKPGFYESSFTQYDITPTISMLMGWRIPVVSLGRPLTEGFIVDSERVSAYAEASRAQGHRLVKAIAGMANVEVGEFKDPLEAYNLLVGLKMREGMYWRLATVIAITAAALLAVFLLLRIARRSINRVDLVVLALSIIAFEAFYWLAYLLIRGPWSLSDIYSFNEVVSKIRASTALGGLALGLTIGVVEVTPYRSGLRRTLIRIPTALLIVAAIGLLYALPTIVTYGLTVRFPFPDWSSSVLYFASLMRVAFLGFAALPVSLAVGVALAVVGVYLFRKARKA